MRSSRKLLLVLSALLLLTTIFGLGWWFYRGSLEVEAQIIYNMGGPQPVARQSFYLLDTDPLLLNMDDPKYKARQGSLTDAQKQEQVGAVAMIGILRLRATNPQYADISDASLLKVVELSKSFWQPHLIQSAQTDFKGIASFENIKPGTYWIMGITQTRAGSAFWNLKVDVGVGHNKVLLDQNNAVFSK